MPRTVPHIIALLLIPAAFAAPAASQTAAHPYFPVGLGYTWRYQLTVTPSGGDPMRGTGTIAMREVVERDDRQYFKVEAIIEDIPDAQQQPRYVRRGAEGVYARGENDAEESMLLPDNTEVGQKWIDASNGFDMNMRIEAVEDLTIGETIYEDCLRIAGKGQATEKITVASTTWFAPGVGEVKSTVRLNDAVMESVLIAFDHPRP